jgi:CBS domain-containing protein
MTSNVKSCQPETNLAEAAALMWDNDCGTLPVLNDAGRVIGMITDRDIAIATATKGRLASEIRVNEAMSGNLFSCALGEDTKSALKTMRHEKVRRLPVVNHDGLLQGILSLNDIVLRAEEAKGKYVPDLSYEDAMSTLKAICEHRPHRAAAHA